MSSGSIELTHRPLKLAFLCKPNDTVAIRKAIQANTLMWGGVYNPIIPIVERATKLWKDASSTTLTGKQITAGYIDAFDPDYTVSMEEETKPYDGTVIRANLENRAFTEFGEHDDGPPVGIGIFEIVDYIYKRECKHVMRHPLTFEFPAFGKANQLFLSAVFGELPIFFEERFRHYAEESIGIARKRCDIRNFTSFLNGRNMFLRRMTQYGIQANRNHNNSDVIFVMNPADPLDIIDYWNLRALGVLVAPIPVDLIDDETTLTFTASFVDESYWPYRYNRQIYHNTTIQRSRTVSKDDVRRLSSNLAPLLKSARGKYPPMIIRDWYPRIWESKGAEYDQAQCAQFEYGQRRINLAQLPEKITFTSPQLNLMKKYCGFGKARYATEVKYRLYGTDLQYAEVLPELPRNLASNLGAHEVNDWRFSKKGIVHLCSHSDWHVELDVPIGESVFSQWMQQNGWGVQLSPAGKTGHQMLKHLGGIWGTGILMNKHTIVMLGEMAGDRHKTTAEVNGIAARVANEHRFGNVTAKGIIERLTSSHVLTLGVKLQCPLCSRHFWVSLSGIDYKLSCPKCLSDFDAPLSTPNDMQWAYKSTGPFNLPQQADGMYTVILALRFVTHCLDFATTPMLSFNAKKGNIEIEADFAVLLRKERFENWREPPSCLFAECKTYNKFEKRDVDRMRLIGEHFPGAYLVFATLRDELTEVEKRMIRGLASKGRKRMKNGQQTNPVMVLTGSQLYDTWWPPESWQELGGRFAAVREHRIRREIDGVCDTTQQLFLDMASVDESTSKKARKA